MAKKFTFFKKEVLEIKDIGETIKALEKISAANVHNLRIASRGIKSYETALKIFFMDLPKEHISHPLFEKNRAVKKLKVVLTIEKGLCGAFLNKFLDFVQLNLKKNDEILIIGEKGKKSFQDRKIKIDYFFHGPKDIPKKEYTKPIKDFIISRFLSQKFNQVFIFYPQFKSLTVQKPAYFNFLPIDKKKFKQDIIIGKSAKSNGFAIYEPSQKKVINYLIKEYLELVFYQKILETKLSELSATTTAMEEAGRKTKELVDQLSYQYFRQKREAITKSINDLYAHRLILK